MDKKRQQYIKRLIKSVRKTISEAPENIEAEKVAGEPALDGKWVDTELLCYVVEQELI